jgi:hypothetical protein
MNIGDIAAIKNNTLREVSCAMHDKLNGRMLLQ